MFAYSQAETLFDFHQNLNRFKIQIRMKIDKDTVQSYSAHGWRKLEYPEKTHENPRTLPARDQMFLVFDLNSASAKTNGTISI